MLATKPADAAVHETYIAAKREAGMPHDELDAEERVLRGVERRRGKANHRIAWQREGKGLAMRRKPQHGHSKRYGTVLRSNGGEALHGLAPKKTERRGTT